MSEWARAVVLPMAAGAVVAWTWTTPTEAAEVAETHWMTSGDGAFEDASNWSNGVPDENTRAVFNTAGNYTVSVHADAAAAGLDISAGNVRFTFFNPSGSYYPSTLHLNQSLRVTGGRLDVDTIAHVGTWNSTPYAGAISVGGLGWIELSGGTTSVQMISTTSNGSSPVMWTDGTLELKGLANLNVGEFRVPTNGTLVGSGAVLAAFGNNGGFTSQRFVNNGVYNPSRIGTHPLYDPDSRFGTLMIEGGSLENYGVLNMDVDASVGSDNIRFNNFGGHGSLGDVVIDFKLGTLPENVRISTFELFTFSPTLLTTADVNLSFTSTSDSAPSGFVLDTSLLASKGQLALKAVPVAANSVTLEANQDGYYDGIGIISTGAGGADAALIGGVAGYGADGDLTGGGPRTINLAVVSDPTPSTAVSNVVTVTGTGSDMFVLQIGYDDTGLSEEEERALFLAWRNEDGDFVNAILGNSDGGLNGMKTFGSYNDSLFKLSYFGVDILANTVWAVIDHNSAFVADGAPAVVAVPSPAAAGTGLVLLGGLILRRRRGDMAA